MTRIATILERAVAGGQISFREHQRLVEALGFRLTRISGSHHIYHHPMAGRISIQGIGKDAKTYQVRQMLDLIEQYGLGLE